MEPTSRPLVEFGKERRSVEDLYCRVNTFLRKHGERPVSIPKPEPLRIAVMGEFNAGKSTLVNALLGEEVAVRGAIPTTMEPSEYSYGEYRIVDLPGTEACQLENEKALKALRHAHVVLRVVSSQTGLDHKVFWNDLIYLCQNNYPWMLVINDKQPYDSQQEAESFRERVMSSFLAKAQRQLGDANLVGRTFWLDAEHARLVRIGEIEPSDERSYNSFLLLEQQLLKTLRINDQFLAELRGLRELDEALNAVKGKNQRKLKTEKGYIYVELLDECKRVQAELHSLLKTIMDSLGDQMGGYLDVVFSHASQDIDRGAVLRELNRFVQQAEHQFGQKADHVLGILERRIAALEIRLPDQRRPFRIDWTPPYIGGTEDSTPPNKGRQTIPPGMISVVTGVCNRLGWKRPLGGIFGKVGSRAVLFGAILSIGVEMLCWWLQAKKERKEAEEVMMRKLRFVRKIQWIIGNAKDHFESIGRDWISIAIQRLTTCLTQAVAHCQNEDRSVREVLKEIAQLQDQLNACRSQLALEVAGD